jgi:acetoin utilization deacetylase AcuC-like enzyme
MLTGSQHSRPVAAVMQLAYHDDYFVPLPAGHPFPMAKYPLLAQQLRAAGLLLPERTLVPAEMPLVDLARVHAADYLGKLATGSLTTTEQRQLGFPWSPTLWRRARLAAAGTLLACEAALECGLAGNLAGGTHHAFADHGEGFCMLNDVAVALRALQARGRIAHALVVDVDVHQGNGTAAIFEDDASVFTLSLHGERNYPTVKARSSLDVGLPDGIGDDDYLAALAAAWSTALGAIRPDLLVYLAGVDPADGDRYGRMRLTDRGLAARDRFVLGRARALGLPVAIVLGGGYAPTPERTATLHANTFRVAAALA